MKQCTKCLKKEGEVVFRKHSRVCMQCQSDYNNKALKHKRASRDPDFLKKSAEYRLKKIFGIDMETYEKLYKKQKGLCKICKRPESRTNKYGITSLAVDHNHKTGEIKELLCMKCNMALGHFEDNIVSLKEGIKYLRRHSR